MLVPASFRIYRDSAREGGADLSIDPDEFSDVHKVTPPARAGRI